MVYTGRNYFLLNVQMHSYETYALNPCSLDMILQISEGTGGSLCIQFNWGAVNHLTGPVTNQIPAESAALRPVSGTSEATSTPKIM